jgi:aspartate oxidase
METHYADVWVIGSGAAGLSAAIAAAQAGVQVAVVGKSAPGQGTSTTLAGGAFAGPWHGLSAEAYRQQTLEAGRGLNDTALLDVVCAEAAERFEELREWGLAADSRVGAFVAHAVASGGGLGLPMGGRAIVRTQAARARKLGVHFHDGWTVRRVVTDEAGVQLLAYSGRSGRWTRLCGGAAVLAAGGAGALYRHHDNPQRMTGDACALAFEAGAVLQDMEFVQFYPIALAEPGLPEYPVEPAVADLGPIINAHGEDLLDKYAITARPAAQHARDALAVALYRETASTGGAAFLDLRGASREAWRASPVLAPKYAFFEQRCGAWERPLRIAPVAHFFVGGARIDTAGATGVPGLYAAGEAAAGLHGANRMGGNALTECLVFGRRAGLAAAAWSAHREQGRTTSPAVPGAPADGRPTASAGVLRSRLRDAMWSHGGILRDRQGLAEGREHVAAIAHEAAKMGAVTDARERERLLELQMACLTAALVLEAAERRAESRGAHARADYPSADAQWLGHLRVSQDGGWEFAAERP